MPLPIKHDIAYDDILYNIKHTWFYDGRQQAITLAKSYGRILGELPLSLMYSSRKVKL